MDDPKKRIRFCSPGVVPKAGDVPTCYTRPQLITLCKELKLGTGGTKAALWQRVRDALAADCRYESCWMEKVRLAPDAKAEMEKRFLPKRPKAWNADIHTWLSNFDIDALMQRYEEKYRDFSYLGTVTSDCPVAYKCELSSFDMCDLYKKDIRRVGIIYNLDTHDQGGSHWVAVYIDLKHGREISYFDSYGLPPPPLIEKFLMMQKKKLEAALRAGTITCGSRKRGGASIGMDYKVNTKRHQRGNSECGVFSINYILQKLEGKRMSQISRVRISDADMNVLRRNLFRH